MRAMELWPRPFDTPIRLFSIIGVELFLSSDPNKKRGAPPLYDLLLSFMAAKEDPISGGRHKVIGSGDLFIPPQTSTIGSHLPKAVGAALSIGKAQALGLQSHWPEDSVVLCSFGDASANHSTALGAINTACWWAYQQGAMPLVLFCEDNGIGISVKTPKDWIQKNFSQRPALLYLECDGLNVLDVYGTCQKAESYARQRKRPVFIRMKTVRLLGHAGSDVESNYHSMEQIKATEAQDPLLHTARLLMENQVLSSEEILKLYEGIHQRVGHVAKEVLNCGHLETREEVSASLTACVKANPPRLKASLKEREKILGEEFKKLSNPQHMAKLINWGLTDLMIQYPNTLVFGEDVAEKGGVYHVTHQLKERFGSKRVFNSPLDEQSILGGAIGLAHNNCYSPPGDSVFGLCSQCRGSDSGGGGHFSFFLQGAVHQSHGDSGGGFGLPKRFWGAFSQ